MCSLICCCLCLLLIVYCVLVSENNIVSSMDHLVNYMTWGIQDAWKSTTGWALVEHWSKRVHYLAKWFIDEDREKVGGVVCGLSALRMIFSWPSCLESREYNLSSGCYIFLVDLGDWKLYWISVQKISAGFLCSHVQCAQRMAELQRYLSLMYHLSLVQRMKNLGWWLQATCWSSGVAEAAFYSLSILLLVPGNVKCLGCTLAMAVHLDIRTTICSFSICSHFLPANFTTHIPPVTGRNYFSDFDSQLIVFLLHMYWKYVSGRKYM